MNLDKCKRIWAVPSIHAQIGQLQIIHDMIFDRFMPGDRIVYMGNYTGYAPHAVETVNEILSFRRCILSLGGVKPTDIVYLRGAQEEMMQKLVQVQFAPNPRLVIEWMLGNGIAQTLESYGVCVSTLTRTAGEGVVQLAKWTGYLRNMVRRHAGHEIFSGQYRRAAYQSCAHAVAAPSPQQTSSHRPAQRLAGVEPPCAIIRTCHPCRPYRDGRRFAGFYRMKPPWRPRGVHRNFTRHSFRRSPVMNVRRKNRLYLMRLERQLMRRIKIMGARAPMAHHLLMKRTPMGRIASPATVTAMRWAVVVMPVGHRVHRKKMDITATIRLMRILMLIIPCPLKQPLKTTAKPVRFCAPFLFVSAGIDFTKPLEDQGDVLWWGKDNFSQQNRPYLPFQKVFRGFDPLRKGVHLNCVTATLDNNCGFGGRLICAGIDNNGDIFDIYQA